jgi:hypothetical protein
VHAAGVRIDEGRQGVDVRALELGVFAVLEQLGRQRMQPRWAGRVSRPPRGSRTSASVLGPVLPRLTTGSPSSSNSTARSWIGEAMANVRPARA